MIPHFKLEPKQERSREKLLIITFISYYGNLYDKFPIRENI